MVLYNVWFHLIMFCPTAVQLDTKYRRCCWQTCCHWEDSTDGGCRRVLTLARGSRLRQMADRPALHRLQSVAPPTTMVFIDDRCSAGALHSQTVCHIAARRAIWLVSLALSLSTEFQKSVLLNDWKWQLLLGKWLLKGTAIEKRHTDRTYWVNRWEICIAVLL